MIYLLFFVGLALLLAGGEILVRGAVGLALKMKISQLVVGVTIVSIGTSAPELLVSLKAALDGHPAIAIGNVVGSNIANIALVLGLVAIIYPLTLERGTLRLDWPVMMGASLLFYLMAFDGVLVRYEGILLLVIFVLYIGYSILQSRKQTKKDMQLSGEIDDLAPVKQMASWKLVMMVIAGTIALMVGAQWFLDGAIAMSRLFGVSEHVISVTVVAFGTSVPELATSVIAAIKRQSDISIGNLIGSNSFNILSILGVTATVTNIPVGAEVLSSDMLWMLGVALLLLPFLILGKKIYRFEGVILLTIYCLYIFFVLKAA